MKSKHLLGKIALTMALAVSSSVSVVSAADSSSAQTVKRELDPNAQLFTYMDFEDGWGKVTKDINAALKDTPLGNKDFVVLADALGLSQIKAFGMSSTSLKDGYDNRFFLHTPGGRTGLLAIFPGKPAAFEGARFAPADADLFADARLDAPAVVSAITQIATGVSDNREAATLALAMFMADPTGYGSLLNFKGRVVAIARLHPHQEIARVEAESSSKIPLDVFLRAEGGGTSVSKILSKKDDWQSETKGGRTYFSTDKNGNEIVVIVEGETVAAGLPRAFVEECLTRKDSLAQATAFTQALGDTAQMGHAVFYATPRVYAELRGYTDHAMGLAGLMSSAHGAQYIQQLLATIPAPTKPVISVIVARSDGLLVRERSVQSLKMTLPVVALLTPDFLGQILRVTAQTYAATNAEEHANETLHQKISADLDRAGEAAMRYFAAHTDEGTVKLSALRDVMPEEKLPDFQSTLANDIEFTRQSDKVELELKSGHSITHVIKLTPAQHATIEANLQKIAEASVEYLVVKNSSPSISSLVDSGYFEKIESLFGEDYDQLTLELNTPKLTVTTPGGQEVSYTRDPLAIAQARHRQAERQIVIERNLAKIYAVAQQFLEANPNESVVGFSQLAEKELVEIKPVAGEDYAQDLTNISKNQPKLSITSPRAGTVTWVRPLDTATQSDLTKQLSEIEHSAAHYFAKNPKAEVVISGELLPPPVVKEPSMETSDANIESIENADHQSLPDLTSLVIRRDYKSIKLTLESGQEIEVPRSIAKK